jgi:hypothetical protein
MGRKRTILKQTHINVEILSDIGRPNLVFFRRFFFYPFFQRCEMVLGHHPNIFNIKYHKYLQGIARMS